MVANWPRLVGAIRRNIRSSTSVWGHLSVALQAYTGRHHAPGKRERRPSTTVPQKTRCTLRSLRCTFRRNHHDHGRVYVGETFHRWGLTVGHRVIIVHDRDLLHPSTDPFRSLLVPVRVIVCTVGSIINTRVTPYFVFHRQRSSVLLRIIRELNKIASVCI